MCTVVVVCASVFSSFFGDVICCSCFCCGVYYGVWIGVGVIFFGICVVKVGEVFVGFIFVVVIDIVVEFGLGGVDCGVVICIVFIGGCIVWIYIWVEVVGICSLVVVIIVVIFVVGCVFGCIFFINWIVIVIIDVVICFCCVRVDC